MTYSDDEHADTLEDPFDDADVPIFWEDQRRRDIRFYRHLGCYPFGPPRWIYSFYKRRVSISSNIPVLKDLLNFERDLLLPHVAELLQGLYSVNDG